MSGDHRRKLQKGSDLKRKSKSGTVGEHFDLPYQSSVWKLEAGFRRSLMEEVQLRRCDSDFWILNSVEELRVLIASQFLQVEFQTGEGRSQKGQCQGDPSQTHCLAVWDRCQAGCKSKDSQWRADLLLGTEGKGLMCFRWLIRETSISDAFSSRWPQTVLKPWRS